MSNDSLKQSILTELDTGTIKQTPQYVFMIKEYGMLFVALVTIVIGAFSLAIIFAAIDDLQSTLYAVHRSGVGGVILLLPYAWCIGFALFLYLGYNRIRSSEHGYKYSVVLLGFTVIAISVVGGALIYTTGLAHSADQYVADRLPVYRKYGNPQHAIWTNPHGGLLAGRVVEVQTSTYRIKDPKGMLWDVQVDELTKVTGKEIRVHMPIRVLGDRMATGTFLASEVFAVRPPKGTRAPREVQGVLETNERKSSGVRNTR